MLHSTASGDLIGGVSLRLGTISADISSRFGDGSIISTGYGLGGSLTWYGDNRPIVDAQALLTLYDSDLSSAAAATSLVSGNHAAGHAFGLEIGHRIAPRDKWSITPQAQVTYSRVHYEHFTDVFGSDVSLRGAHQCKGRVGISADHENVWDDETGLRRRLHIYNVASLGYNFDATSVARLSGVDLVSEQDALWSSLGLGGTYSWGNDKFSVYGEATIDTSLINPGKSHGLAARLGLNARF